MLACAFLACSLALQPPVRAGADRPPRIELVDDTVELERVLASRAAPRDVAVRVAAYTIPDADPARTRVIVVGEIGEGQQFGGPASVAYALVGGDGRRAASVLKRAALRALPSGRLVFADSVTVPPGTYRLKLAAMRNLQVGAAEAEVGARLKSAGALRLGDVLIGDTPGADLTAGLAAERKVRGDRFVATLSIGGEGGLPTGVGITFEIAKGASGPAVLSVPAPLLGGDGPSRQAQAVVDARLLPPGDYQARFVVTAGGAPLATVTAPVTLERGAATPAAPAGKAAGGAATALLAGQFQPQDVLDAGVVGPFLDELASRAAATSRPAIELARSGRFVEASDTLSSSGPTDPSAPFLLGLSLYSRGQLQDASEAFRASLRASPDFFVGAFYIGACYAAGKRDQQAVNAWQTSLVGLDQYAVVFRLLGEALARLGQPDRAVAVLDEAATRWPNDGAIAVQTARAALDARRYDRALEYVEAGLARRPADTDLLFVGMRAIFERATAEAGAPPADSVARLKRYRDAYAAAGGPQQALVGEWVAAVEKKAAGRLPG